MTDGTELFCPTLFFYAMLLTRPQTRLPRLRAPPESPLRALFKADKIRGWNRFGETACGIA